MPDKPKPADDPAAPYVDPRIAELEAIQKAQTDAFVELEGELQATQKEKAAVTAKLEETQEAQAEVAAKLSAALTELEAAKEQVDEFRPTKDVTGFLASTPEAVRARFGDETLEMLASVEIAAINKERLSRGQDRLPALQGEALQDAINLAIDDLLGDRERSQPPTTGPLDRVLKMWAPAKGGSGQRHAKPTLRQIPYEPQINNMAGSLADGYERYRLKGFKMPVPALCAAKDCYNESAVGADGEYVYRMYCSADHERRTERDSDQTAVPGVTTRNVMRPTR